MGRADIEIISVKQEEHHDRFRLLQEVIARNPDKSVLEKADIWFRFYRRYGTYKRKHEYYETIRENNVDNIG